MSEFDVRKYPGLHRRGGVWQVQKRVPKDLRHLEPKEQIRRSLKTSDPREAVERYHLEMAEITEGFRRLRADLEAQGTIKTALATGRLELLGRAEVETLVLEWWNERERMRKPEVGEFIDPHDLLMSIREEAAQLTDQRREGDDIAIRLTDQLLVKAGVAAYPRQVGTMRTASRDPAVDRNTEQYRYLCQLVERALRQETILASDHLLSRQEAVHDRLFNPAGVKRGAPEVRTVTDLIAEYRTEREALRGKESTARKYGLLFRVMEEVWGAGMPVQSIGRQQCIEVLSFLQRLPPNAMKRFPRLTLTQAIDRGEAKGLGGLASNTVGSYMQGLTAILRWAENGDWGVRVNTRGLVATRKAEVKRRGFKPDELRKLFAALEPFRMTDPPKYWVPALALFTGARAGEIRAVLPVAGLRRSATQPPRRAVTLLCRQGALLGGAVPPQRTTPQASRPMQPQSPQWCRTMVMPRHARCA